MLRPLPPLRLRPPRHTGSLPGMRYNPPTMRRLARYMLNGLTALSVVLCLATVGLWVRSYWIADALVFDDGASRKLWLLTCRGKLVVISQAYKRDFFKRDGW